MCMRDEIVERLLLELDVSVDALAVCKVRRGIRMVFPPVDAIEVHYVLEGTLHLTMSGAVPLICGPGSVIMVPPGNSQWIAADNNPHVDESADNYCSTSCDGLSFYEAAKGEAGELRLVCGVVRANVSGSFGLLDHVTKPIVQSPPTGIHDPTFAAMVDEVISPGFGTRAVLGALMKICLVKTLRSQVKTSGIQSMELAFLRAPRLHKAIAAVLAKPAAAFNVAALASIVGMSRSAFADDFLAAFAMTPMEFVKKTRMHQAAKLLRSTGTPVKVIADNVGFSSRSHFSAAFRDTYGTDPRSFRRTAMATKVRP
jgi:AraC family transcriptional activator of mtrCDE